ncbi:MAG: VRR-NUC domain-containing protein [Candidatus Nanohaloarchaea archaeon]|nr:VRR-NUC domain-containing protein [Candidatus Nanohaloarchaea archaeon]
MKTQYMSRVPTGNGAIVTAAVNPDTVQRIATAISDKHLSEFCGSPNLYAIDAVPYEDWGINPSYLKALRRPFQSAQYTLQHGASRTGELSLVDWWTFSGQERRREIEDTLFETFRGSSAVDQVAERADISTALNDCFPVIGDLGVAKLIESRAWEWIKEERREQLSSYSRRALRNGKNGRNFEEQFEAVCERNHLDYWKRSKGAFRRHLSDKFAAVQSQVESFKGIPDYFIDKGNTHALSEWVTGIDEREWTPDGQYAFVECKYGGSHLREDQREMVELLAEHGLAVYLFRGSDEKFEFSRIE